MTRQTNLETYIRSVIFYIIFIFSIIPTSILMWILPFFRISNSWKICCKWGTFINFILKHVGKVHFVVDGEIPKPQSPTLLICNHTGPWETVGLMPFYPFSFTYILKKELLHWKYLFFALGLRAINPIPISRKANSGDLESMVQQSQHRFEKKLDVLIFPGGTRKPLEESIHFGPGGLLLAKKLKCRALPIFVNSEAWARGKIVTDYGLIYPETINVRFGPLFSEEMVTKTKTKELYSIISDFYQNTIYELTGHISRPLEECKIETIKTD